jgi:predicted S18 family serine protease
VFVQGGGDGGVGYVRTGPPMAPRRTASAFLAAFKASSVKGEPVASIEACNC